MFKISFSWGQAHWIVPPAVISLLVVLLAAILIRRAVRCAKKHTPFLNFKAHILVENWDKIKLIGTFVLLFLYPFAMGSIHFLPASILFIFLFNILFCGVDTLAMVVQGGGLKNEGVRSLLVSLAISIVGSTLIWYIFGHIFKITLP